MNYKKGDILEIAVDDLAFGGKGVGRINNFVWFIKQGIPGQTVSAKITKIKKEYGEAEAVQIIDPSPYQIEPPCPHFGICGGCQLQHLTYEKQVEYKTKQINRIFKHLINQKQIDVRPTIPAKKIYGYRNKMEFTFSNQPWQLNKEDIPKPENFALGLHIPRKYNKVLDIDTCLLQSDNANLLLKEIGELTKQTKLRPYSTITHQGFWRFLVIREGKNTDDLMANIITSDQEPEEGKKAIDWIVHKLFWRHPELTTFLHSVSDKKAQVAFGRMERLLLGFGKITECLGDRVFDISPNAFFQTNTKQTEVLFNTIIELADFQVHETVYDLYCGTGAISIWIADKVKQIVGIEVIESAVEDGHRNIKLNGFKNIEMVQSDMKDALQKKNLIDQYGIPDVVILDPPRGGPHPKTLENLINLAPQKMIYVSCNPPLLARDLQVLCEKTYTCKTVQPIDMFPHTGHIEVVALLVSNK